jgi:hypothetical protein
MDDHTEIGLYIYIVGYALGNNQPKKKRNHNIEGVE